MAEIYGDKMPGARPGDPRAKWAPIAIGVLIVVALVVAIVLMRG